MTPAERDARRQAELDRIFELGRARGRQMAPLTDEQIERVAFIINPRLAPPRVPAPATLPQAA